MDMNLALCRPEERTKKLYKGWLVKWWKKEREFTQLEV
jgi:hypothetical protein